MAELRNVVAGAIAIGVEQVFEFPKHMDDKRITPRSEISL